jgi:hypothetical protein
MGKNGYTYPGWGGTQSVPTGPSTAPTYPGWGGPQPVPTAPTPLTPDQQAWVNAGQGALAEAAAIPPPAAAPAPAAPAADPKTHYMDAFRAYFASLGVTFGADIEAILKNAIDNNGYTGTETEVAILLPEIQNTQSFKDRFVGYEAYKANHNGVAINLSEYVRLEGQYRDILSAAGLPAGFYDDYSDFGNLIANNVAPDELRWRAETAVNLAKQVDPTMRNLLSTFYGVATGDIAAYFLDPSRAQTLIQHQYESAGVASWAARNGYAIENMQRFEALVDDGLTAQQASQGYATVRALDDAVGAAASVYGESYGQADAERDVFFGDNEARRRIMAKEQGTFGGSTSGQQGTVRRTDY